MIAMIMEQRGLVTFMLQSNHNNVCVFMLHAGGGSEMMVWWALVVVQMMVVVVEGRKEIKRRSFSYIQYCIYPHS